MNEKFYLSNLKLFFSFKMRTKYVVCLGYLESI